MSIPDRMATAPASLRAAFEAELEVVEDRDELFDQEMLA